MIYYKNEGLEIRDILEEDVTYLFRWSIDHELNKHDPRPLPRNIIELKKECETFCNSYETEILNQAKYIYFIITYNRMPIGFINLFSINREKQNGELGIKIGNPRYWKQGIATKSLNAITDYIFKHMSLQQVYLETTSMNKPAIKLAMRNGFQYKEEYLDGDYKFLVYVKNNK